jgi:hypothetical protein
MTAKIKINVRGDGRECPFQTGVTALRRTAEAAVPTWFAPVLALVP